jgi:hypothetical protein
MRHSISKTFIVDYSISRSLSVTVSESLLVKHSIVSKVLLVKHSIVGKELFGKAFHCR